MWGMDDLGVELHAVEEPRPVLEGGDRRRGRRGGDLGSRRGRDDGVAVAHPDGLLRRQVLEECRLARFELGLSELGDPRALDRAAEVARHELHAVADAERGDPELEDLRIDVGRSLRVHRGGTSRQDESDGTTRGDLVRAQPMAYELGVDTRLAHATCDQLAVLTAEVDHEDRTLLRPSIGRASVRLHERDDACHQLRR